MVSCESVVNNQGQVIGEFRLGNAELTDDITNVCSVLNAEKKFPRYSE